ncbi:MULTISPECIES: helix-turn-helix domain-containing protein [Bacteroides]|nr:MULTISPECIES: helix-turn-helix domain-containing protein [Bacteroides]MCG4758780.1 hypothetical protein [Bacteroides eggerthii]
MRRELFVLIYTVGCLAVPRNKIGYEWFRLFFMPSTMIHIGQMIEAELHRQERSVIWFARKLYCDRTNVYSIFKRQNIDTDLLMRICYILNCNFFDYYSTEFKENPLSHSGKKDGIRK